MIATYSFLPNDAFLYEGTIEDYINFEPHAYNGEFTEYQLAYWTITRNILQHHQWERRDYETDQLLTSHPDLHLSTCTHTTLGVGPIKMPMHRVEDELHSEEKFYISRLVRRHQTTTT